MVVLWQELFVHYFTSCCMCQQSLLVYELSTRNVESILLYVDITKK